MPFFEVNATFVIEAKDFDKAMSLHDDAMAAAQFSVPECKFSTSGMAEMDPSEVEFHVPEDVDFPDDDGLTDSLCQKREPR